MLTQDFRDLELDNKYRCFIKIGTRHRNQSTVPDDPFMNTNSIEPFLIFRSDKKKQINKDNIPGKGIQPDGNGNYNVRFSEDVVRNSMSNGGKLKPLRSELGASYGFTGVSSCMIEFIE